MKISFWKRWLKFNIYKKLWSVIGKRPWTYIMRDFYHKFEYLIIIGFFSIGYFSRPYLTMREFYLITGVGTLCFILGHLFWGRTYKPNQQGN